MTPPPQPPRAGPDERIAAWEERTRLVIVVAAVAPVVTQLVVRDVELTLLVDMASWLVFLVDLVVHERLRPGYWRTGRGLFDLAIVLLTFPWYVFPAVGDTRFMGVFRLARLMRLALAGGSGRVVAALRRLGVLGLWLAVTGFIASAIVLTAEPPEAGFDDFGDAAWWVLVSFTTVGYGDLYPVSPAGRLAGVLIMVSGLAALGTVSAVLAGVFLGGTSDSDGDGDPDEPVDRQVLDEIRSLRAEVAELRGQLIARPHAGGGGAGPGNAAGAPAPGPPAGRSGEDAAERSGEDAGNGSGDDSGARPGDGAR